MPVFCFISLKQSRLNIFCGTKKITKSLKNSTRSCQIKSETAPVRTKEIILRELGWSVDKSGVVIYSSPNKISNSWFEFHCCSNNFKHRLRLFTVFDEWNWILVLQRGRCEIVNYLKYNPVF